MTDAPAASRASRPPIRTCVGCRAAVPQAELVRVAVVQDRTVADPRRRLPGRGAYVHARPACLAAAGKGGLARSLRRGVSRAEVDGLARAVLQAASALTDAPQTGTDAGLAAMAGPSGGTGDPGIIPPGMADADAVEIGSPSTTRTMSSPRPTSQATDTHSTGRSTTSVGGSERPR